MLLFKLHVQHRVLCCGYSAFGAVYECSQCVFGCFKMSFLMVILYPSPAENHAASGTEKHLQTPEGPSGCFNICLSQSWKIKAVIVTCNLTSDTYLRSILMLNLSYSWISLYLLLYTLFCPEVWQLWIVFSSVLVHVVRPFNLG